MSASSYSKSYSSFSYVFATCRCRSTCQIAPTYVRGCLRPAPPSPSAPLPPLRCSPPKSHPTILERMFKHVSKVDWTCYCVTVDLVLFTQHAPGQFRSSFFSREGGSMLSLPFGTKHQAKLIPQPFWLNICREADSIRFKCSYVSFLDERWGN